MVNDMKKTILTLAVLCGIGLMAGCGNDNSSGRVKLTFQLPWSKTATTGENNNLLNTKWIIEGDERPKESAVYLFINNDSSVIVAYYGTDNEYGYVYEADEDCIKIKINAYNSRATKWEGSRLIIDRKNNHLYAGLDAYKSRDPRKRQSIEQIPMSDYKGEKIVIDPPSTLKPIKLFKQKDTSPNVEP